MLERPNLSFKNQRDALSKAASTASVDHGFGQAMQSAQSLLQGFTETAQAGRTQPGTGVTAEALEALWDGRNTGLASGISDLRSDLNGIPDVPNMATGNNDGTYAPVTKFGDREKVVYQEYVNAGFAPDEARAMMLNIADESGFVADIVEGAPNVHGTRGQGHYQLTDISEGVGRRTDYLNFMKRHNRDDLWSDNSQAQFAFWESNNTEKAGWDKVRSAKGVGNKGANIVRHVLRPAEKHRIERERRYAALGY